MKLSKGGRYRIVHVKVWQDDKFPFMEDDAKMVWFHAYTSHFSNGIGFYHASIEALAAEIRWSPERYRIGMQICIDNLLIKYDERFQQVYFPNFFKWNPPLNPKHFTGLMTSIEDLAESPLKSEFFKDIKELAKEWGKSYEKVLDTCRIPMVIHMPYQEQEQDKEKEQDKKILTSPENGSGKEGKTSVDDSRQGGCSFPPRRNFFLPVVRTTIVRRKDPSKPKEVRRHRRGKNAGREGNIRKILNGHGRYTREETATTRKSRR
ncbi:hypothetical protein [Leptospirillum ferriphilum]|uniref:Uncharacterized protein n=1 Tax=Leptospirillum ferriphilum TaxID=178606 RepID=A0A2I2MFF6_9BACT|nr:hypothetical protein [Leptospirillum ferriphilum]